MGSFFIFGNMAIKGNSNYNKDSKSLGVNYKKWRLK